MKRLLLLLCLSVVACGGDPAGNSDTGETNNGSTTGGKSDEFVAQEGTIRIDRMGHVEVGPLVIADMPSADAFNQEEPFGIGMTEDARDFYAGVLQKGLVRYDNYDSFPLQLFDLDLDLLEQIRAEREGEPTDPTRLDWIDDLDTRHPFVDLYLTDALYLDMSKPCGDVNYLEPELSVLAGVEPQTCGGRHINEDVIDQFATVLINGPTLRDIHPDDVDEIDAEDADPYPDRGDSIEEPARPASSEFPYLDEPYSRFLFN